MKRALTIWTVGAAIIFCLTVLQGWLEGRVEVINETLEGK